MGTLILILLLLAALFGVVGAVLKAALILALSVILAIVLLAAIGAWYVRSGVNAWRRELWRRAEAERRRRDAYDVDVATDEPDGGGHRQLGDGAP